MTTGGFIYKNKLQYSSITTGCLTILGGVLVLVLAFMTLYDVFDWQNVSSRMELDNTFEIQNYTIIDHEQFVRDVDFVFTAV